MLEEPILGESAPRGRTFAGSSSGRRPRRPSVAAFLVFAALGAAVLTLAGCAHLQSLLKEVAKPTARVRGAKLQDLSFKDVTMLFDIEVQNPYSAPLPLVDIGYRLASGGNPFLEGKAPLEGSVPARGSRTVSLPARIGFKEVLAAVKGVRPGAVFPYTAGLDLGIDPPGLGPMTLPLKKEGELPIPAVPKINVAGIDLKDLSWQEAAADVLFRVENTNSFPVDVSRLNYALSLAGSHIADTGIASGVHLKENTGETIKMPIRFSPAKAGLALFNVLKGEEAAYSLDGSMVLGTRFGDLDLPLKRAGKTNLLRSN